jgi:heme exporter protein A
MIIIKGLIKKYGLNPVLRGIQLHVRPGEFVTLVGPNGAGKSTLMRIVATLLRPDAGEVEIGGWPLATHAHMVRRHIGLVSHQSLLYQDMTAAENLTFFARLYGLDEAEARVQQALKTVGLRARQRDPVSSFSRGMTQRLTIARATLHEPDVLLLDEPYTGLDQEAVLLLDRLLHEEKERGRTILMITHDLSHSLNLSQRLVILHNGRIIHETATGNIAAAELLALYRTHTSRVARRQNKQMAG